ncbi:MAG: VWA domain-containing protein [Cypionkella sp.]|uniref:vWA domain-containing protein n=1 Tax=Cypionkella sp. TaxID=2811411 RepID=UPI002AB8D327|nr:VWA domain-containing protein [Cypionkella sp.]MDZ4312774.1 VWA domain-containing protein [Cypionkella sp.]
MRLLTLLRSLALMLVCLPTLAHADGRTIIVLDGSGSMWGQIDGKPKLEIAREALAEVLKTIPADTELGLIAYGHRSKGACDDIETLVAPATGTAPAIASAADKMQFLGKTPLTEAVRRAASELRSTEEKATVVLITDGIETCEGDPCALARELEASGVDFTAHVVGFGLTKDEGRQVACLAEDTGGQYITADDLDSLTLALQTTVISAPEPTPEPEPAPPAKLDINFAPTLLLAPGMAKPEDNTDIAWELHAKNADGSTGARFTTEYNTVKSFIEPGDYRLITKLGEAVVETDLTLTEDNLAAPEIVMNAARVILHPKPSADGAESNDAAVKITSNAGIDTTNYGPSRFYLPAGDYTITGTMGQASVTETLSLKPGDLIERDLIIGSGLAVVDAYYIEGVQLENTQHSVEILAAKQALDGSHDRLTTSYGPAAKFELSPGDYIAKVTEGGAVAEVPFTVKAGERVNVSVILEAGVLAVAAAGANSIEIFKAKADLNGFRTQMSFDYAEETTIALPEGDYLIEAMRGDAKTEATAKVTKGERTEVSVP